jgi:hypothetical protein
VGCSGSSYPMVNTVAPRGAGVRPVTPWRPGRPRSSRSYPYPSIARSCARTVSAGACTRKRAWCGYTRLATASCTYAAASGALHGRKYQVRGNVGHPIDAEGVPVAAIEVIGQEVPAPVGGDQPVRFEPPASHLAGRRVVEAGLDLVAAGLASVISTSGSTGVRLSSKDSTQPDRARTSCRSRDSASHEST